MVEKYMPGCLSVATKEMQIKNTVACHGIPMRIFKPCLAVPNTARHREVAITHYLCGQDGVVWQFVIKLNNNMACHPYSWTLSPRFEDINTTQSDFVETKPDKP